MHFEHARWPWWPIWMALRLNSSGDLAPVSKDAKSARNIVQFPQMFMTRKTAFIWFEISQNKHFSEVINAPFEVTSKSPDHVSISWTLLVPGPPCCLYSWRSVLLDRRWKKCIFSNFTRFDIVVVTGQKVFSMLMSYYVSPRLTHAGIMDHHITIFQRKYGTS